MAERERDLLTSLASRVRAAIERAHELVADAELVTAASRLVRDPGSLARRCAWCGRLALGRRWVPVDELPAFIRADLDEHVTHGICERCLRRLEESGESRPLER